MTKEEYKKWADNYKKEKVAYCKVCEKENVVTHKKCMICITKMKMELQDKKKEIEKPKKKNKK